VAQIGHDGLFAGFDQLTAHLPSGMGSADRPDRSHSRCSGGAYPYGRVLDHEALSRRNAHPFDGMHKNVRSGFAAGNIASGEYLLEQPRKPSPLQAHPDAIERERQGDAFRPA